jgi:hypothetical protein
MSSILDVDTLLAVDVGSVNTRAWLFDVVDGRYRLVSTARMPSTGQAPILDVSEGVHRALIRLQSVTGRRLLDESESLIMPVTQDGAGVDAFVATSSAGPSVKTVVVGLMPGVSLESVRRLAASSYLEVVDELGLADRRGDAEKIDVIVKARPDLLMIAGGTDGGARASVLQLVETLGLAVGLLPDGRIPRVIFAGNRHLAASIVEQIGETVPIALAPNIRPSLEEEDLSSARGRLAEIVSEVKSSTISGFDELKVWSGGNLMLTADAFGRVIRYLSEVYDPQKGSFGIDVGANQTTVAASFAGDLRLAVHTDLGLGASLPGLLKYCSLEKIMRWLPINLRESVVRDFIYNKALHPSTVPMEKEELFLEYALVRQVMRAALFRARVGWPPGTDARRTCLMPPLAPILVSGGTLARSPKPGLAALALLDALQPVGVTSLLLDAHCILPALGAAAGPMPMVTVQALETGALTSLGTVVVPVGKGRPGKPVVQLMLERENGEVIQGEVKYGQLATIPLGQGEQGRLTVRPERGFDVGFGGRGRAGRVAAVGGAVGVIIDARGRPVPETRDAGRQRDLNQKWLWDIGATE